MTSLTAVTIIPDDLLDAAHTIARGSLSTRGASQTYYQEMKRQGQF